MDVLARLADAVDQLRGVRARVLVGIDGPDAAGKTDLASRLGARLAEPVVRASADDFQHSREIRRQRGDLSAAGYYLDGFDHDTLAEELLRPFSTGARRVMTAHFDYRRNQPAEVYVDVPANGVLVVDGVFLQRQTLRSFWSLVVYLTVPPELSRRRGLDRDAATQGPVEELERRYLERYLPAQARYRAEVDPETTSNILIDNTDPSSPHVLRWDQPRL